MARRNKTHVHYVNNKDFSQAVVDYVKLVNNAALTVGPIILQYPFYAGIMGIMADTGLIDILANNFFRESFQVNSIYSLSTKIISSSFGFIWSSFITSKYNFSYLNR